MMPHQLCAFIASDFQCLVLMCVSFHLRACVLQTLESLYYTIIRVLSFQGTLQFIRSRRNLAAEPAAADTGRDSEC